MRRHDQVVAALQVEVAHVVLELLAEDAAARMPDPEARSELVRRREQVQLPAQLAVVAPLGLLQPDQVGVELRLVAQAVP